MIGLCLFLAAASVADEQAKPRIWLAVGRAGLVEAIEPLARMRRAEGFETIISTDSIEAAIASSPRRPTFLLLIGDDERGEEGRPWYLPTRRRALYRWRASQSTEFASDALWGDVDGDLLPDIAVGRIPARSREDVARVVAKIIAFERREATPADLRLVIWGGSPSYGPAIDAMATGALLRGLDSSAPHWLEPWVISGDPNHALCGWPPEQAERFAASLSKNGVLGILMGHSSSANFVSMYHADRQIGFSAAQAERFFAAAAPAPPVVIFACDAGKFDAEQRSLAETMLLSRGGPVAVIAATTESHPLTNYYSGFAQIRALATGQDRLGLMWMELQLRASRDRNPLIERLLRDVEGKLEEEIDASKLRRDQLLMYALLGDPATRIRLPRPLKATIARTASGWKWTVERPPGATRLWIGIRAVDLRMEASAAVAQSDADAARRAFAEANEQFRYEKLASLDATSVWSGEIARRGLVRLVAAGPGVLYATVIEAE